VKESDQRYMQKNQLLSGLLQEIGAFAASLVLSHRGTAWMPLTAARLQSSSEIHFSPDGFMFAEVPPSKLAWYQQHAQPCQTAQELSTGNCFEIWRHRRHANYLKASSARGYMTMVCLSKAIEALVSPSPGSIPKELINGHHLCGGGTRSH
jgi:hypothetical protein